MIIEALSKVSINAKRDDPNVHGLHQKAIFDSEFPKGDRGQISQGLQALRPTGQLLLNLRPQTE